MALSVVILAAGQGKRMRSALPKVLHPLAGKPLLAHVIDSAQKLLPQQIIVVIGHGAEAVRERLPDYQVEWVTQHEQLGTGHAVMQALPSVPSANTVLIVYGDVPLIEPATVERLANTADTNTIGLLSVILDDPTGYGRIIRDHNDQVEAIVEDKDASDDQRRIRESNSGILAASAAVLKELLERVGCENAQAEYYLTDVIKLGRAADINIQGVIADDHWEVMGVNSRSQLAVLERVYQRKLAEQLMEDGVSLVDPARIDVRGELSVGQDSSIDINCIFEGKVEIGSGVRIGAHCLLRDCSIGDGTEILPYTIVEQSTIASNALLGPFARLRPGCTLADGVRVGNFVELKNAVVASGSKVNHLSYVGDTDIGAGVNVGAGTITCNYDGAFKHRTVIRDNAFIGSNASLVAPVTIGEGATIGAGSVVSKHAPDNTLTLTRAKQVSLKNWQRPIKKPK